MNTIIVNDTRYENQNVKFLRPFINRSSLSVAVFFTPREFPVFSFFFFSFIYIFTFKMFLFYISSNLANSKI